MLDEVLSAEGTIQNGFWSRPFWKSSIWLESNVFIIYVYCTLSIVCSPQCLRTLSTGLSTGVFSSARIRSEKFNRLLLGSIKKSRCVDYAYASDWFSPNAWLENGMKYYPQATFWFFIALYISGPNSLQLFVYIDLPSTCISFRFLWNVVHATQVNEVQCWTLFKISSFVVCRRKARPICNDIFGCTIPLRPFRRICPKALSIQYLCPAFSSYLTHFSRGDLNTIHPSLSSSLMIFKSLTRGLSLFLSLPFLELILFDVAW